MSAPSPIPGPASEPDDLHDLTLQVRDLQQRVVHLEKLLVIPARPQLAEAIEAPGSLGFDLPPNIAPVLGKMFLAVAGAYILRALTDWGTLPTAAGVAIGLIYAVLWLLVAARSPLNAKFAAALTA